MTGLRGVRSQSASVQRITNTTEEGINLNPSLSGDGRRIAFESTVDLAHAGGSDDFRALRATLSGAAASFTQMGVTRAVAPATSQDGSHIAFASKDNPLGTNPDGNSEIFIFDNGTLRQATNTVPADISTRFREGNFQPSITDDARFIAFSSNRDLAGLNSDGNLEIFIYDTLSRSFAQLTNTAGTIGATDAKISGDGTRVAYIRDSGTIAGSPRDLLLQPRTGGAGVVAANDVLNLSLTYGRAISDNGQRVVFAAPVDAGTDSQQVFLYDAQSNRIRQITALAAPGSDSDVPLHPTISGNGTRIAFATRRNVNGGNSDDSVELYVVRVATGQFTRITSAPSSAKAAVVSSLNDDGSLVAFNFPRVLSGTVSSSSFANNCEIYVANTGGVFGSELIVLNGASFGHEPSDTKAVAPDSIAVALGDLLATTLQAQLLPGGTFPLSLGGTTVTVNNRAAQIFYVSPELVSFLVPAATETGTASVVVTNSSGTRTSGTVAVMTAAPGVFTRSGDGIGEGVVVDAVTGRFGPFDPTGGMKRLIVNATGVRHASEVIVTIGGRLVPVEAVTPDASMPGRDLIRIQLPADLSGVGTVDLVVRADSRASNPVTVTMLGQARRDIIINEVLADPPLDLAGDANHDGTRDSSDDEFVELVNSTTRDIDISGYQILTRSATALDDTLRHTFAPGTIIPAGTSVVVFGGGSPPVNSPVFGGAQIFTASKDGAASSLSLTNSGGIITVREASGALVAMLSYGAATGLEADDDQSLTRAPDITGNFVPHQQAAGSDGRAFSPGTRVDGTPFSPTPAIARIEVSPASANIGTGARKQFTARAFSSSSQELTGVIFRWQSSAPAVARIDQNGLATALSPGSTQIGASARGVQSAPATLTVFFQAQVLTRIEVSPASSSIPPGGQQQYTARALDQNDNEIAGVTFAWSSSNTSIATIDQSGLASALSRGTTTIRATAQSITGAATLTVVAPVLVINEVLADPPGSASTDLEGDANHDGERSSSEDEFVELVNSSNTALNISGWTLSTRSPSDPTVRTRHTFAEGTTLPAHAAVVIFGGGAFDPNDAIFACAQVVKASSGRLTLTNSGLTIMVRDASGNLFAQLTYGGTTGLNGGSNQSLTRSPDVNGNFIRHTEAVGAQGRKFSPGTKVDGSPFGQCEGRLTSVRIMPASASVIINRTTQFTAQAFDQFGQPLTGIPLTFASSNTNVATVESVTTNPTTGIATATIRGRSLGTAQITAQATDGSTVVMSSPATLTVTPAPPRVTRIEVTPTSAEINRGGTQQFTAQAFNQNTPVSGVTFTWTSSNAAVASVDSNGLASGIGVGVVTIRASAPDGLGGTVSGDATLTVQIPLVINELLADPPDGAAGDANRDGTRDGTHDEFIELVNNSNSAVDISGVIISDATSNRFTFPANTSLAAGRAVVIFGGGSPPANDPNFGGALIFKTGSGGLSLNNGGDTINVKLPVAGTDVLITSLTYGSEGDANQSLTRSPDITGAVTQHLAANGSDGRVFSPGTQTDGTPFGSPTITRIEVMPASATIDVGDTQTFTARAFSNSGGPEVEVQNVSFIWDSSDTGKATVAPTTGTSTVATGIAGGSATIRARAGGQQGTATLTINFPPISRIEVTPTASTITIGGTLQFTARAFDASNQEITGVTFTWTSTDESVATVDQNGLATSVNLGMTTIKASAQGVEGSATLNVVAPSVVINEALADPPDGLAGDANHDGVRSGTDDEFIELVNSTNADIDISGWSIRTRSLSGTTESTRHTFAANTILPAGDAIVIFGGGAFDPDDPVFGGAQVVAASSGGLSLTNTGLTIILRDSANAFAAQLSYGGSTGLNGDSNQSLTRSPDVNGNFVLHTAAAGANGRRFSPGTRADGSFFVPRMGHLKSVTISPASASVVAGQTTQFTAQAFDQYGQPLTGIMITFASSDTNIATIESVMTDSGTGIATAVVRGQNAGMAEIKATASDGTNTVMSSPAMLDVTAAPPMVARVEVLPAAATINRGGTQQFTATAFDQNDQPVAGVSFTWTSSDVGVATVDSNGLATGHGPGTATITATAPDGSGGMVSDDAVLNVQVPLVINELLADVPLDNPATTAIEGDSNRDGVRSSDDDEFIELLNNSNSAVDISGVIISDMSSNRFTFPANTSLAAGRAVLVFGGGTPPVSDPAFGGALIFTTTSLGKNDGGDTITVKVPVSGTDVTIDSVMYGTGSPIPAPSDQSLTRSPDAEIGSTGGGFVAHSTVTNAVGRVFSPGTRTDGTPFGSPPITRIEVMPASATIDVGGTQAFTARAFSNSGGPEVEVQNVSFIWDSSDTGKATVAPTTGASTTATGVAAGSATIRARAGSQASSSVLMIEAVVASVELTPASTSVTVGNSTTFTATARDGGGNSIPGITFTFSLRDQSPAGAGVITMTTANTVTVRGDMAGSVTVVASYTRPSDNMTLEDTSALTINDMPAAPLPTAGQVIVNEAVVSFATSATQVRNDFLELYNTTAQALDISGMVISFRPPGSGNTPATVTLPGTVGSNMTLIEPNSYFLIVNGAETFGVMADFNASTGTGFDLNNTTGGIKIEVNSVKLDGLAYQSGATPPASPFNTYGEGTIFTFTSGATNDLVRSPNANDTGDNANDFRRNGTAANVTPKAPNPTLFFNEIADDELISFVVW